MVMMLMMIVMMMMMVSGVAICLFLLLELRDNRRKQLLPLETTCDGSE